MQVPILQWFVGEKATSLLSKLRKDDPIKVEFLTKLRISYEEGAKYILRKLPLNNSTLLALSCIDPVSVGTSAASPKHDEI